MLSMDVILQFISLIKECIHFIAIIPALALAMALTLVLGAEQGCWAGDRIGERSEPEPEVGIHKRKNLKRKRK